MTMVQNAPTNLKPTYGYYRQPNGWITASPATDTDELQYRRGGWEPLLHLGRFEMVTPYVLNHPLEALFMRGGARELPVDQVVQMGLHLNPPMIPACKTPLNQYHKHHEAGCLSQATPVVFPQLQGMTGLDPFPCAICANRVFPTEESRDQHTTVMHAPEKSDQRTGQALSDALIKGLGGRIPVAVQESVAPQETVQLAPVLDLVSAMKAEMEALRQELAAVKTAPATKHYTVTCPEPGCGLVYSSDKSQVHANRGLVQHQRNKHPKPKIAV